MEDMDMSENARDWLIGLGMAAVLILLTGFIDAIADWLL
jgi:hypothetical protein